MTSGVCDRGERKGVGELMVREIKEYYLSNVKVVLYSVINGLNHEVSTVK